MVLDRELMRTTPPPQTKLFLLRRRPRLGVLGGFLPVVFADLIERPLARLEITDGTVRCTLVPRHKLKHVDWLSKRLDLPDLAERVKRGEEVTVFEYPRNSYQIKWPKLSMGTLFEIGQPSSPPWVVSFGMPRDYGRHEWMVLFDVMNSPERKRWRTALTPGA
jgi:hypothetical protein